MLGLPRHAIGPISSYYRAAMYGMQPTELIPQLPTPSILIITSAKQSRGLNLTFYNLSFLESKVSCVVLWGYAAIVLSLRS
jgi:hypothetical protein